MKAFLFFVTIILVCSTGQAQRRINFLTGSPDEKYNQSMEGQRARQTIIMQGNGKKGQSVVVKKYQGLSEGYLDATILMKGNFKRGDLIGQGEVIQILSLVDSDILNQLKTWDRSLGDFASLHKFDVNVHFNGIIEKDGWFSSGYYKYSGGLNVARPVLYPDIGHLSTVLPNITDERITYERRGQVRLTSLQPNDTVIVSLESKDEKYVLTSVFEKLIYRKDVYTLNGGFKYSEIFSKTPYGCVGWYRKYEGLSRQMTLNGFNSKLGTIDFQGLVLGESMNYNGGTYYGKMVNGHPSGFGILITDDFFYEGFFNNDGKFDGYGFYQQFPYKSYGVNLTVSAAGIFENGNITSGEVYFYTRSDLYVVQAEKIDQRTPFPVSQALDEMSYGIGNLFGSVGTFLLNGRGSKIEYDIDWKTGLFDQEKTLVYQVGTFKNDLLHGEGKKLMERPGKNETYYVETVFVDGKPGPQYNEQQRQKYLAEKQARLDSTWAEANFNPGDIISKDSRYFYVNEIHRHGKANLVPLPITLTEQTKDGFATRGITPVKYYRPNNQLLASPWFTIGYVIFLYEETQNAYLTNLTLCHQCEGVGTTTETEVKHGVSVDEYTVREVVHDGDYYTITQDVTKQSAPRYYSYEETKVVTCDICNGSGCISE